MSRGLWFTWMEKSMAIDHVINVSEADFEYEVLKYSQNVPVVVDFWADWCRPCKALSPLLEQIAQEGNGSFRLAKVDADANPNLAVLYNVRSLPTVKAFSNGQIVSEFVGLQPEERLRDFVSRITPPSPATLALEKGNSLLFMHQWAPAEVVFKQILEQNPAQTVAILGLAKTMLAQNKVLDALKVLRNFPPSRQFNTAQLLLPLAEALEAQANHRLPEEIDLDYAFNNSLRLASRGNIPAAMDGLLDLLRQDKSYRQGKGRGVVLGLLELMGDENPETREYRADLASILF
jgi:putative thioredoxin